MRPTDDLPPGFVRIPGYVNAIIRREGVIGVQYIPAWTEPGRISIAGAVVGPYLQKSPDIEHEAYVVITIQGGKQFDVKGVTFWEVLEWLK